jgi:hypothetical protein
MAAANDTAEVKEDTKIYESADVMRNIPGKRSDDPMACREYKIIRLLRKRQHHRPRDRITVVEKNGSLSDVKVKKDIGGNCGAEAVRAVKTMPTWIPGQVKNEDKRVR